MRAHDPRAQPSRPEFEVHLEADVLDLMTAWIERYRREAEERFARLDALLAELDEAGNPRPPQRTHEEGRAS